ncbi:HEAT repeat domain-containing protein [Rhodoflexus caldus]|uniref:HEAT repeat domain-containing protein n=1 Tax=Rhodoflexus caldus TaxID=2891236 RepID=UPI002029C3A1|nr:HEAT repeat domain-containing protein [Rhodoflexus caldus]
MQTFTEEEIQSLMIDLAEGKLTGEIREMVLDAINRHSQWKEQYAQVQELFGQMAAWSDEQPDDSLRQNFAAFLLAEQQAAKVPPPRLSLAGNQYFQLHRAAAVLVLAAFSLLIIGAYVVGRYMQQRNMEARLATLETAIAEHKQKEALQMLNNPTAAMRIKAANYYADSAANDANDEIIAALISTLKNDPNLNVQLTAARALSRFGNLPHVRAAFIGVLENATDPHLQIELIELLVSLRESDALGTLKKLMDAPHTEGIVRAKAAEGVGRLYEL